MLLVDFGENTCKFVLVEKHEKNIEVRAWGAEDARSLEHATEHVLEKTKSMHGDTESILLSFPSSLWRSRVLHERTERKNATLRIDSAEKKVILEDLLARARLSLKKWAQDSSGILAEDICINKLRILTYAIDGYSVQDILGFSGTHLDVQILAVFALAKYLPIVDNIVQRFSSILSPRIIHLAETIEGFSQTRSQDALYIDIGDASCRIIVTQQKHLAFVEEIPHGGRDFTLYLQETLSLGENVAKDFKERYTSGDFSFPLREVVKKGFLAIAEDLMRLIYKSLHGISADLPLSVFLFGGASKLPEMQEVFQGSIFEGLPFREKPRVSFLLPKDLWNFSEFSHKTNPVFTPLFFLPYAPLEVLGEKF